MRYIDEKGSGLNKEQLRKLEEIAKESSIEIMERGGLDIRNNDHEDFPEIGIWAVQRMLERAYKAGIADAKKMV